jgi:hypothetical protein
MHTVFSLRLLYTGLNWTRHTVGKCTRRYKIKLHSNSVNCTSHILQIHITQRDVPLQVYAVSTAGPTGTIWQLTGLPTYRAGKTSLEYWVLVNSSFHTSKNYRKLSEIGVRALTHANQPCPRPKNLKIIGLHGCQIIYLPGAPTSVGLVLAVTLYSGGHCQHPDYNKTRS